VTRHFGMIDRRTLPAFLLFALCAVLAMTSSLGADQGTSLSYQGRLNISGAPANGTFDFEFALWDAATTGALLSGPISRNSLAVANGQFSTTLDFGGGAFNGSSRWIEIAVRASGSPDPTTILAPRQQVSALPYALHALDSPRSSDLTTLSNNFAALLSAQLNSLSNSLRASIPSGVTVASMNPADATLVAKGLVNTFSIAAPSWINGATANQPSPRSSHSSIWTGQELIVWGGKASPTTLLATGGRYRPDLDQWTSISTISAPAPRSGHSAIWTGDEMIVWGGFGTVGFLASGGRFQPTSQRWSPISTSGPAERVGHIAIWTGSRMVIWGGRNATGLLNDGTLYDPATDLWSTLSTPNPPEPRHAAAALWTGSQILIWGGEGASGPLSTGSKLNFNESGQPLSWQPMTTLNAPSPRSEHSAIWTGSRLVVWGGANPNTALADGAAYDPATDSWTTLSADNAPSARAGHVAIWSGAEMIIWSGLGVSGSLASGGALDPIANTWRTLQNPGSPTARDHGGAIWANGELLVFGGFSNGVALGNLQRVNPQPTWHLYRKL
jgi:hypothetical protein